MKKRTVEIIENEIIAVEKRVDKHHYNNSHLTSKQFIQTGYYRIAFRLITILQQEIADLLDAENIIVDDLFG